MGPKFNDKCLYKDKKGWGHSSSARTPNPSTAKTKQTKKTKEKKEKPVDSEAETGVR
jgi:hypothetical protein